MNTPQILRPAEPFRGRLLVTSDIHGHVQFLDALLERAAFGSSDLLVTVGDLIDKGPHCLATVRRVMGLCEEGRAIALAGNCDLAVVYMIDTMCAEKEAADGFLNYLLSQRRWKGSSLYDDMCREVAGAVPNTADELFASAKSVCGRFEKELHFLRTLPTVLETKRRLFVHGGLPQDVDDRLAGAEKHSVFEFLKVDHFLDDVRAADRVFERDIVCGHWPVSLYCEEAPSLNPLFDRTHRVLSMDGGCGIKRDGQLNLLIFPSSDCEESEITLLSHDGFPTVTAHAAQEPSQNARNIRWTDNRVRVLRENGDTVEVERISDGYRMWVPTEFLFNPSEYTVGTETCISDCTDHLLSVREGEMLSVLCRTSRGLYAKKDGVIGWYLA